MAELDNRPAWTGRPGGYEVWFLTCTDPISGIGLWLRAALHAPHRGPARGEAWFACFDPAEPSNTFGIHRRHPIDAVSAPPERFQVDIAGSTFRSGSLAGALSGDGHDVRWDLRFPIGDETYRLLPGALYRAAPTRPYAPNVNVPVSGEVVLDGRRLRLDAAPGHQGHVFGTRHAERWAWAHCAAFEDEDAVLEALTAQGRRGPFPTPYLTSIGLRWGGRWIRFVGLSRRRDFGLGTWRVDAGNRRYRLTGRIEAPVSSLLRARYEDPDGTPRWCHNSEIASCRLALFERRAGGFDEVALLESRRTTHAEWAGRTPATAVTREHVEVPG